MSNALGRFCSYHYDMITEFYRNKKQRGEWKKPVHIAPSMYSEIEKEYMGEWMKYHNFPFQIVYDGRS